MSFRSIILSLLLALVVLLVLLGVATTFLLLAYLLEDPLVTTTLRWTLGILAALSAADLALLVIALSVDRVRAIDDEPDEP